MRQRDGNLKQIFRDLSGFIFFLGGGGIPHPQKFEFPPEIFGQNYIFFTIYYLLFIVFFL